MKKTAFCAIALALVGLTVGCTKDGKYNPKEKISKIYRSSTSQSAFYDGTTWIDNEPYNNPKHVTEAWTWDGKKLVSITEYDSDGNVDGTVKFEYDGNQLEKIVEDGGETYTEFEYDGRKVASAKSYSNGQLSGTMTFTHDGKKISKIIIEQTGYEPDDKSVRTKAMDEVLWSRLMPVDVRPAMQAMASKGGAKATESVTVTFEWDGDNVKKITMSDNANHSYSATYTYDKMKNPFYGSIYHLMGDGMSLSENNTTSVSTSFGGDVETETYTYKYDGKWPVEKSSTESYDEDNYRSTYTSVHYYEYAD